MKLAIWDIEPAEFLVSGITQGMVSQPFDVERHNQYDCAAFLRNGRVDAALLPVITILRHTDEFDVLPAVALSSWTYPYARIILPNGFEQAIRTLVFDPVYEQEAIISQVILGEHYGAAPKVIPRDGIAADDIEHIEADAILLVQKDITRLPAGVMSIDVGQEWSELANYPMVEGMFATRKGEATPDVIRSIRDSVLYAEEHKETWMASRMMSEPAAAFFSESLRVRFDDLVIASLTEFRYQLYYRDVLDEIPDIPVAVLEEDEDGEDEIPLL